MPGVVCRIIIFNFLQKHGSDAVCRLLKHLNDDHLTHREIAALLHTNRANLTKFIHSITNKVYVLNDDTRTFIDELEQQRRLDYERQRRAETRIFTLAGRIKKKTDSTPPSPG